MVFSAAQIVPSPTKLSGTDFYIQKYKSFIKSTSTYIYLKNGVLKSIVKACQFSAL